MSLLSRKQQMLMLIAASGPCTYEMLERELGIPRTTVVEKMMWLMQDRAVERTKVGRTWHLKPTAFGKRAAKMLDAIRKLEAGR